MSINLTLYGLSDRFRQEAATYNELFLARVSEQHRDMYKVISPAGEINAEVSGKLLYNAVDSLDLPAVGDWVMIDRTDGLIGNAVIHQVLTRKSVFTRQAAGTGSDAQIIAANIDMVFICISLNADFNLRRLERYLTIAWESMAEPVIVLTKSDLCDSLEEKLFEIANVAMGVMTIVCSAANGDGLSEIKSIIAKDKTVAFIGSSGVGKSTLINKLIGRDMLATQDIRDDDDKGRHTTTYRQLILLPKGGIVIDTPGMRELQIYAGDVTKTFSDIEEIALGCRFADCLHDQEPGCAVRKAIAVGELSQSRLDSYQKLRQETAYAQMNSRQREHEKINRMFGSKTAMKQAFRQFKKDKR